jgi:hypothetical protein
MEAFKPSQEPLGAVAADAEGAPEEQYGEAGPVAIPGVTSGQATAPRRPSGVSEQSPAVAVTPPRPQAPAPGLLGRIFGN